MNIMVTGAAGGYGAYALEYLKKFAPDDTIIAQVRDKKKRDNWRNWAMKSALLITVMRRG